MPNSDLPPIVDEMQQLNLEDDLASVQERALTLRKARLEALKADKLHSHPLNSKQWKFLSSHSKEVMLSGLNQQGKTTALCMGAAWDLTGLYPPEYTGLKLYKPFEGLIGGKTAETTRDLLTDYLLKDSETGEWGGGFLPKESFDPDKDIIFSRGGVAGQIDYVLVSFWHPDTREFLGKSKLYSRSMHRPAEHFQGYRDLMRVWIDEEPKYDRYEELSARSGTKKGTQLLISETPTLGATELWLKFFESVDTKRWEFINYSIDDCEHLTEADVQDQIAKWEHSPLREARLRGMAPMGQGLLLPFRDVDITISDDFKAPYQWPHLIGLDYPHGTGNFAAAKIAWDTEEDVIYLLSVAKLSGQSTPVYADRVKSMGGQKIPVTWPHDMSTKIASGGIVADRYRRAGLNMLPKHAQFQDGSNATMTAIELLCDYMAAGRFKVKASCLDFFEEKRKYRQKNGMVDKSVPGWDDVIDGVLKCMMSLRFATPIGGQGVWSTTSGMAPGRMLRKGHGNFYRKTRRR